MKTPLLAGVTEDDIEVESLRRTADRASASVYSTLLGVAFVVLTQYETQHQGWLIAFVVIRLFFSAFNHHTEREIREMGAKEAIRLGYHRRLVFGLGAGGASWGLLVGLLAHPTHWSLNDQLLAVLLVLLSALVLVTTAYMWRAMVAFTGAMWLNCLIMLCVLHWPVPWQILLGLPVVGVSLLMYGRQLHRQSREGVVLDLINRRLNAELEAANARLHAALGDALEMATRDPLTKALNRRAFLERAQDEAASMRRLKEPAAVMILDLDHFKRINDTHGHAMGDSVLVHTCTCVQACLRNIDTLARWGGEEFVVLMPRTSLESGTLVAERIRRAVAEQRNPHWPVDLVTSTSIGLSIWWPNETMESALTHADAALYLAKLQGRNRIASSALSTLPDAM